MNDYILSVLNAKCPSFFICQFATIIGLFLLGLFEISLCQYLNEKNNNEYLKDSDSRFVYDKLRKKRAISILLSFPTGLSLYVVAGFTLLSIGIRMNVLTIVISIIILNYVLINSRQVVTRTAIKCDISAIVSRMWITLFGTNFTCNDEGELRNSSGTRIENGRNEDANDSKTSVSKNNHALFKYLPILCVVIVAFIAVSGIISITISNDSMYYFSLYPRALALFGKLRREFNVFLTDVGLGSALIGTLPYMFGFSETFGIQTFFNFNFALIFAYAVIDKICPFIFSASGIRGIFADSLENKEKRMSSVLAAVIVVFFVTSMPYLIVANWVMANVYFMEFSFICAYMAYRLEGDEWVVPKALIVMTLSILRMEGGIFVLLLVLCISVMKYSSRQLGINYLLPVLVMQILFDIKIFCLMNIDAPYTFLTKGKAVLQIAGIIAVYVYVRLRDLLRKRLANEVVCYRLETGAVVVGLLLLNAAVLIKNSELYFGNLEAFYLNLTGQSGWGFFPLVIISVYVMTIKRGRRIDFFELFFIGFILMTLVVSWARGDVLRESLSDSGNRVLLQVAPFAVFALVVRIASLLDHNRA